MAQTTSAITLKNCKIEYNTTTTTTPWVDISGFANLWTPTGGARKDAQQYTFDGDTAIIGSGKREPMQIVATIVYTETAADPYLTLLPYYTSGSSIQLRATPTGQVTGTHYLFATAASGNVIKTLEYPGGAAEDGKPVVVKITLLTPSLTTSTATS